MSIATARTPVVDRLTNEARKRARAIQTAQRRIVRLQSAVERDQAWIRSRQVAEWHRFRRAVPADPFILDVFASIDVTEDDVWLWRGGTNNHGVPTVRVERGERTVVRVLAEALGVVATDEFGILYPTGDRNDVNPFHRVLRRADHRQGNGDRFKEPT